MAGFRSEVGDPSGSWGFSWGSIVVPGGFPGGQLFPYCGSGNGSVQFPGNVHQAAPLSGSPEQGASLAGSEMFLPG